MHQLKTDYFFETFSVGHSYTRVTTTSYPEHCHSAVKQVGERAQMKKYRMSGDEAQKAKLLDTEKDFTKKNDIWIDWFQGGKKQPGRQGHT